MQGIGDSARFPAFQARLFPRRTVCGPGVWFGALVPCSVSPVEDRACPHLWLQSQPCKTEWMTKPLHVARGQLCPIPDSGLSCHQKSREMGASKYRQMPLWGGQGPLDGTGTWALWLRDSVTYELGWLDITLEQSLVYS